MKFSKLTLLRAAANLMVCVMLISAIGFAATAQDYPFSGFVSRDVAMREKAKTSSLVLLTVPEGDSVYVTGEQNGYYIVEYEGREGYILKTYITVSDSNPVAQPTQIPAGTAAALNYESLYLNAEGISVKALQEALSELGFYTGSIDSKFGTGTKTAVRNFQSFNGLASTGIADEATQETLYEKKVKNAKGKQVTVKTLAPIQGISMKKGNKGDAVITLKNRLEDLGYYTATEGNEFDAKTETALKAFQKKNDLYQDGVAGEKTQKVLYSDNAIPKNGSKSSVTATPTAVPQNALYPYQTTVNAAVVMRKSANVSSARILTVPKGKEVKVMAEAGDEFLKISYSNNVGYVVAAYVDIPAAYVKEENQTGYRTLKSGVSGSDVKALSEALKELKFYTGAATENYTNTLQSAVKLFQKKNGYAETGVMTAAQQKKLFEGRPKNASGKAVTVKTLPAIENYPMERGDVGDAVSELQRALKTLGYYSGTIGNTFDTDTYKAVKAFQKAKGLTVDGKAGEKTLAAIKLLTWTPTPVPYDYVTEVPVATPINENNVIIMQSGTRGVAVKNVQARLVELGYYTINPDGIYNSDDINAVREFQKANGLKNDGICGLDTQLILFSDYAVPKTTPTPKPTATPKPSATPKTAEATPTPTPEPQTDTVLKTGSKGDAVKTLQTRLKELGFYTGTADGIYGSATSLAVKRFQQANSLTADGVAGAKTQKKLYSTTAKKAVSTVKPTATPAAATTSASNVLMMGDKGADVKNMQNRLVKLGYLSSADGDFGAVTFAALVKFQQNNNLTITGTYNAETRKKLTSSSAKSASTKTTTTNVSATAALSSVPKASEVRFADWYNEIRTRARAMNVVTIYDPQTGLHYQVNMFSFGKHADCEPVTSNDTEIMKKVCGTNSWTPHAVWVIFQDGRVYMASTHSHGHGVEHNTKNNLTGHVCLHFPREMSDAEATGPYAVSHQNAILNGWEATQNMIQ